MDIEFPDRLDRIDAAIRTDASTEPLCADRKHAICNCVNLSCRTSGVCAIGTAEHYDRRRRP